MESSAEEHHDHMLQEDRLAKEVTLHSQEENSTKTALRQGWIPETNHQNSTSLPKADDDASEVKNGMQEKKRSVAAAFVETVFKLPSETMSRHIESSSTNTSGVSHIVAAAQLEHGAPLQLDHSEAAEIFQLMQRLKEDDRVGVSPGDYYAYDDSDTAEQSEEESLGDQEVVEGQSGSNFFDQQSLSNDLSSKAEETLIRPSHEKPMVPLLLSHDDYWWPSLTSIENESAARVSSKIHGKNDKDKLPSSAKRWKSDPKQPGVLQKLPHCRIHVKQQQLDGITPQRALLCTQVVEEHPTEPLVCCSVCYTWRHAACGGHHSWSSSQRTINPKTQFIPLCDLCFREMDAVSNDEELSKALQRQRVLHLRKTLLTNQVVRYAAFSKHAHRSFKWPLGSVLPTHIAGHIRSVNARHEKAEMLWQEMAVKLHNPMLRSRDRVKIRHRVFEKLQQYIEEAELCTDRHNMILFLQSDVARDNPLGYEVERRNFFDPLDDPIIEDKVGKGEDQDSKCAPRIDEQSNKSTESSSMWCKSQREISDGDKQSAARLAPPNVRDTSFQQKRNRDGSVTPSIMDSNDEKKSRNEEIWEGGKVAADRSDDKEDQSSFPSPIVTCARASCDRLPRYDSLFCSDACGVSQLERDLLDALEYSEEVHPSQLR